ncbi:MAG TPA: ATP-binding protein [Gemmatimonadaceae bacterium]|nr:ATP-binding protein [Gemmatimonadaceae bacterium]
MATLALVAVMLLGSVLIPARLSYRILRLLAETTGTVEPARLAASRLQSGLDTESATLQRYALLGDSSALQRYHATLLDDDRTLAELDHLTAALHGDAARHTVAVRLQLSRWRANSDILWKQRLSSEQLATALRAQQADRDAVLAAMNRLSVSLAAEDANRDERIAGFELRGLTINAALVLVSLATLFAVAALVRRERRLSAMIAQRVEDEAALRQAAEAFSVAFGREELANRIATAALAVMRARAAFVEEIASNGGRSRSAVVAVQAVAGVSTPPLGVTKPYQGSLAERVTDSREPLLVSPFSYDENWCETSTGSFSAIVLPVADSKETLGALLVLRESDTPFRTEDVERARTLAHLIWIACEKVRLFEEERAGRRELERVIKSRSRLMRGFSHDLKNPLGAADGYAELLSSGVYGEMVHEQRRAIDSIHTSIQTALALIDDLHELARAETGHIALSRQRVELLGVLLAAREEYRAAAISHRLTLSVDVPVDDPVVVETDRARVRQIVSNLLSNAIKYTPNGSIVLRVKQREDAGGCWAAIEVADTGIGITTEERQLLFEEFVRLGVSDVPGAGLGLAISQRLASTLGGRITVESEVGHGSTFTLWLPMHQSDALPLAAVNGTHASVEYR